MKHQRRRRAYSEIAAHRHTAAASKSRLRELEANEWRHIPLRAAPMRTQRSQEAPAGSLSLGRSHSQTQNRRTKPAPDAAVSQTHVSQPLLQLLTSANAGGRKDSSVAQIRRPFSTAASLRDATSSPTHTMPTRSCRSALHGRAHDVTAHVAPHTHTQCHTQSLTRAHSVPNTNSVTLIPRTQPAPATGVEEQHAQQSSNRTLHVLVHVGLRRQIRRPPQRP